MGDFVNKSLDFQARCGRIEGHTINEYVGTTTRFAACSCGWQDRVVRQRSAWGQTASLRRLEREHLRAAGIQNNQN